MYVRVNVTFVEMCRRSVCGVLRVNCVCYECATCVHREITMMCNNMTVRVFIHNVIIVCMYVIISGCAV